MSNRPFCEDCDFFAEETCWVNPPDEEGDGVRVSGDRIACCNHQAYGDPKTEDIVNYIQEIINNYFEAEAANYISSWVKPAKTS